MTAISPSDARARFIGVVLLVSLAFLSLIDFSRAWGDSAWLAVLLFGGIAGYSLLVAHSLIKVPAVVVRTAWVTATAIAVASFVARLAGALVTLPGSGKGGIGWLDPVGLLASLVALMLIGLAGVAMRELTLRGVAYRRRGTSVRTRIALTACLCVLLAIPGAALGAEKGTAGTGDRSASTEVAVPAPESVPASSSRDTGKGPLFGSMALVVLFSLSAGYVAWANRTLALRVLAQPEDRLA